MLKISLFEIDHLDLEKEENQTTENYKENLENNSNSKVIEENQNKSNETKRLPTQLLVSKLNYTMEKLRVESFFKICNFPIENENLLENFEYNPLMNTDSKTLSVDDYFNTTDFKEDDLEACLQQFDKSIEDFSSFHRNTKIESLNESSIKVSQEPEIPNKKKPSKSKVEKKKEIISKIRSKLDSKKK